MSQNVIENIIQKGKNSFLFTIIDKDKQSQSIEAMLNETSISLKIDDRNAVEIVQRLKKLNQTEFTTVHLYSTKELDSSFFVSLNGEVENIKAAFQKHLIFWFNNQEYQKALEYGRVFTNHGNSVDLRLENIEYNSQIHIGEIRKKL